MWWSVRINDKRMDAIEKIFQDDLAAYLQGQGKVDAQLPDAPDIEGRWAQVGEAYLPDGMREFAQWPAVSLGWMMYVGMAIAHYWDEDWELYNKVEDLYGYLRDRIDYDHMDDYICQHVLLLGEADTLEVRRVAGECAQRAYSRLCHLGIEPGTKEAFRAYVAALHQLYLMGAAMELKRLGYRMTRL